MSQFPDDGGPLASVTDLDDGFVGPGVTSALETETETPYSNGAMPISSFTSVSTKIFQSPYDRSPLASAND
jgi:hypothetical protein